MKTTEKQKESLKKYYIKNKEKLNILSKKRYEDNKEEKLKVRREYVKKNPDKIVQQQKNWYLKNRELKILKSCEYIKNNKLKHCIYNEKRRSNKNNTCDKSINEIAILKMMNNQKSKCIYCDTCIIKDFHIDHINPLSRGGLHSIINIQLLCPNCNCSKGNKNNKEFIKYRILTLNIIE